MKKTLKVFQAILLIVGAVAAPSVVFTNIAYNFLHNHDGANIVGGIVWFIYLLALFYEFQSIHDRARREQKKEYDQHYTMIQR